MNATSCCKKGYQKKKYFFQGPYSFSFIFSFLAPPPINVTADLKFSLINRMSPCQLGVSR